MNNSPEFHLDGKKLTGKKILLVTTAWNKDFLSPAVDAIQEECETFEVSCEVVFCPGSLEIPATILRKMTDDIDGVLALGLVIKGDTPHFKLVSNQTYASLADIATSNYEIPLINGILTVDNKVQAQDRISQKKLNKGKEFALSLFHMICS
jgi:6,7-dimethyl-8-ribityllumazine synthase